ncbi:MAG: S26 family signal peptidase [Synergistaceae bacterium]|nr:S26 family signal peptidase [Synergistaceae bacterium]
MRRTRKIVARLLIAWAALAALLMSGRVIWNRTASVPLGLWWRTDGPIERGDVARVPIRAFRATEWVPDVYWRKNAWGEDEPFLKRVAGLPGDLIEEGPFGLLKIDGEVVPNSAPLSTDRAGRALVAFPLPYRLAEDEAWLLSWSPRGFDSRYLGPASLTELRRAVPILTW